MRRVTWFVFAGLLASGVGLVMAADPSDEYARMAGTWVLGSGMRDGKAVPEDEVKQTRLVVTKNTFIVAGSIGTSGAGTFKIDPTKKPKTIDSTATDGPDKGKTSLGIYE